MQWVLRSITLALAAMISAAPAVAADKPRMYEWIEIAPTAAPAADFLMENGTRRQLADFKGQVVLLNLWATWCTPCLKELPTLDKLEETYAEQGLVVLPLSLDTLDYKQLRAFVDKLNLQLPHLAQDTKAAFNAALKPHGLPATYLIDREGKLRASFSGSTDWMSPEQTAKIEGFLRN